MRKKVTKHSASCSNSSEQKSNGSRTNNDIPNSSCDSAHQSDEDVSQDWHANVGKNGCKQILKAYS